MAGKLPPAPPPPELASVDPVTGLRTDSQTFLIARELIQGGQSKQAVIDRLKELLPTQTTKGRPYPLAQRISKARLILIERGLREHGTYGWHDASGETPALLDNGTTPPPQTPKKAPKKAVQPTRTAKRKAPEKTSKTPAPARRRGTLPSKRVAAPTKAKNAAPRKRVVRKPTEAA